MRTMILIKRNKVELYIYFVYFLHKFPLSQKAMIILVYKFYLYVINNQKTFIIMF